MNIIRSTDPFRGTMYDAGLHNWLVAPRYNLPGIPFAVTIDTNHSPVGLDLPLDKALGLVETTSIGCIGAQGYGKTFFAQLMTLLMLTLEVGGGKAHAQFPSLKHNRGRAETAPLVEDWLNCKLISPKSVKLNPIARLLGMTFEEQYRMVELMLQFIRGSKLSLTERKILNQQLRTMYDSTPILPSFPVLYDRLKNYQFDKTGKDNESKFEKRYQKAALNLQLSVELLLTGLYGQLFTGDGSEIVDLYEQPIVSWDFKAVDKHTRSLIEIVLNAINMSAILPDPNLPETHENYGKPKHPERIPQSITMDEAWHDWSILEVAETKYEDLKTQRSTGITTIMLFHRLADLTEAIGKQNTRQLELARNAIREIEVWLIGRQHRSALPEIREFFDLPEYVIQSLPTLAKGQFWLITPWHPTPILIAIIGTELEIKTFNTDGANHALLKKYFETHDAQYYLDYLEEGNESEEDFEKHDPALSPVASL